MRRDSVTTITEIYRNNELVGFRVEGHANYSIPGRDIVCSAISTLTINVVNSIKEITNAELEVTGAKDDMQCIVLDTPNIVTHTILKATQIGYKSIAEEYPDNVTIVQDVR